jgi:hypothetical protein
MRQSFPGSHLEFHLGPWVLAGFLFVLFHKKMKLIFTTKSLLKLKENELKKKLTKLSFLNEILYIL